MVWNINKRDITTRKVVVNDHAWPAEPSKSPNEPDPKQRRPFSAFIESGCLDVEKEIAPQIDKFEKDHGI